MTVAVGAEAAATRRVSNMENATIFLEICRRNDATILCVYATINIREINTTYHPCGRVKFLFYFL